MFTPLDISRSYKHVLLPHVYCLWLCNTHWVLSGWGRGLKHSVWSVRGPELDERRPRQWRASATHRKSFITVDYANLPNRPQPTSNLWKRTQTDINQRLVTFLDIWEENKRLLWLTSPLLLLLFWFDSFSHSDEVLLETVPSSSSVFSPMSGSTWGEAGPCSVTPSLGLTSELSADSALGSSTDVSLSAVKDNKSTRLCQWFPTSSV